MSSTFGQYLRLTLFGQSHGPAVGVTVDGLPAGMRIDMDALRDELRRRAPGRNDLTTPRREPDEPMCHGPLAQNADTPEKATAAWNKLVVAERARIDALVGYVSPLEYAWARRRKRHA